MRLRAHAKINLYLRVIGPRPDGYHDVETILHGIDIADYLELRSGIEGFKLVVRTVTPVAGVIEPPPRNIVQTSTELLERTLGKHLDAEIELAKRIPMGAGLGGGSADAAATLIGLSRLHQLKVSNEKLLQVATELGADVPFFLHGGTALATGIGHRITHLDEPPKLWFVLGVSRRPLWTVDVYRAWDDIGPTEGVPVKDMVEALGSGHPTEIAAAMRNDLQAAALTLRPELSAAIDALEAAGALRALVSGSGPTLVALCEGPDHARSLGAAVRDVFDHTQVTCSQPRALEILDHPGREP